MNRRIIKEARALLPAFAVTVLATIVPCLIWPGDSVDHGFERPGMAPTDGGAEISTFLFAIGCAFMAASAFGNEFHARTMPLLLSQPISRGRVWLEKMLVLGVALAVCLVTVLIYLAMVAEDFPTLGDTGWLENHTYLRMLANDFPTVSLTLAAIPLCIFCTTPCLTLLSRNTLLGVLLSSGPPMLIGGIIAFLIWAFSLEAWLQSHPVPTPYFAIPVVVYCALFFRSGYDQFARLQMVDPYKQELSLPLQLETFFSRALQKLVPGYSGPFASLVKKELRLQQISFLAAAVFLTVAVAGGLLYPLHITVLEEKANLAVIILTADFGLYILLLPLLAGALSVAEERAWGVTEWQVTLPPSLCKQWSIKMLVTFATSLILGVLLPAALALAGIEILGVDFKQDLIPSGAVSVAFVIGHLLLASVAVFAASRSKSTFEAVLFASGMLLIAGLSLIMEVRILEQLVVLGESVSASFWPLQLPDSLAASIYYMEVSVLVVLLQRFAYLCYRGRGLTLTQRLFQALALLMTLFIFLSVRCLFQAQIARALT